MAKKRLPPDYIPGQIDLVCAITTAFGSEVGVSPRVMNAIIAGASLIVEQLERPDVKASPNMGLRAWLASDDTGRSSEYMAHVLAPKIGETARATWQEPFGRGERAESFPRDPADFGRCVRLLEAVPALRQHVSELAAPEHGSVWNQLAARWDELEAMYHEDLPTGKSERLYKILSDLGDVYHGRRQKE